MVAKLFQKSGSVALGTKNSALITLSLNPHGAVKRDNTRIGLGIKNEGYDSPLREVGRSRLRERKVDRTDGVSLVF